MDPLEKLEEWMERLLQEINEIRVLRRAWIAGKLTKEELDRHIERLDQSHKQAQQTLRNIRRELESQE